jgi:predicted 3-demethylubiquinone-9 3-methyltransferase (glyoxalase superfamily)
LRQQPVSDGTTVGFQEEKTMQKISPFLWFDNQAEEAVTFYTSVFRNSKIGKMTRYGEAGPGPAGSVMVAEFELEGLHFTALNGGPMFKFTEAISMSVDCKDQAEVDYFWSRLAEGGQPGQCGWLKDKFGLSWQVIPEALPRLLGDPDAAKASRVMQAMLQMTRVDVAKLEAAYAG